MANYSSDKEIVLQALYEELDYYFNAAFPQSQEEMEKTIKDLVKELE